MKQTFWSRLNDLRNEAIQHITETLQVKGEISFIREQTENSDMDELVFFNELDEQPTFTYFGKYGMTEVFEMNKVFIKDGIVVVEGFGVETQENDTVSLDFLSPAEIINLADWMVEN